MTEGSFSLPFEKNLKFTGLEKRGNDLVAILTDDNKVYHYTRDMLLGYGSTPFLQLSQGMQEAYSGLKSLTEYEFLKMLLDRENPYWLRAAVLEEGHLYALSFNLSQDGKQIDHGATNFILTLKEVFAMGREIEPALADMLERGNPYMKQRALTNRQVIIALGDVTARDAVADRFDRHLKPLSKHDLRIV